MRYLAIALLAGVLGACDDDNNNGGSDMSTNSDMSMKGDMGNTGDGGATPTCSDYCNKIMTACTGNNKQYIDAAQCMAYCTTNYKFPVGNVGDSDGNTLGCRTYHAVLAISDATTHCVHAGPSGGDACGTWCENYCYLSLKNCTGGLSHGYTSNADCLSYCANNTNIPKTGMAGATSGNTVQCRIYHLGVAGTDSSNATTHCPHAGKVSTAGGCT